MPTNPAHGKVFYQGRAAAGFRVSLYPLKPWAGPQFAPSGTADSNGEFKIRSFQADDGAPAGEYSVTFVCPTPADVDAGKPEGDLLQGRYADPKKSTFRVTVKEGENELPPFQLN